MKRLAAGILVIVMALSLCAGASATTGFSQPEAKANEGFKISAKVYEGYEDQERMSLSTYLDGGSANELRGRVVIGTMAVYQVKVVIPKLEDTALIAHDYTRARINLDFTNFDVKHIYYPEEAVGSKTGGELTDIAVSTNAVSDGEASPSDMFYATKTSDDNLDEGLDQAYSIIMQPRALRDALGNIKTTEYTFVVVGQVMRTAEVTIKATFKMGQDVREYPYSVFYIRSNYRFMARLTGGEFSVERVDANYKSLAANPGGVRVRIVFDVGTEGKLSNARFVYGPSYDAAYPDDGTPGTGEVSAARRDDWIWAIGKCSECNAIKFQITNVAFTPATLCLCSSGSDATMYSRMKSAFNRILVSLGFTFDAGSVDYGYVSATNVNRLCNLTDMSVTTTTVMNQCTELALVDIPQTGASGIAGIAVLAAACIAGVAVASRKKRS